MCNAILKIPRGKIYMFKSHMLDEAIVTIETHEWIKQSKEKRVRVFAASKD